MKNTRSASSDREKRYDRLTFSPVDGVITFHLEGSVGCGSTKLLVGYTGLPLLALCRNEGRTLAELSGKRTWHWFPELTNIPLGGIRTLGVFIVRSHPELDVVQLLVSRCTSSLNHTVGFKYVIKSFVRGRSCINLRRQTFNL